MAVRRNYAYPRLRTHNIPPAGKSKRATLAQLAPLTADRTRGASGTTAPLCVGNSMPCKVLLLRAEGVQLGYRVGWTEHEQHQVCIANVSFGCNPAMPGRMWVNHGCRGRFLLIHNVSRRLQCGEVGTAKEGALTWCPPLDRAAEIPPSVGVSACARQSHDLRGASSSTPAVALVLSGAFSPPDGKYTPSDEAELSDATTLRSRQRLMYANLTSQSIRKHLVKVNRADVFIFSWSPGLRAIYRDVLAPVAAQYEANAEFRKSFEAVCERPDRRKCHWVSVSWAYATKRAMLLVERHEQRTSRVYDLVIFYRPDVLMVHDLDVCNFVRFRRVVYHTTWSYRAKIMQQQCGDTHFMMARSAAAGFAGMYDAFVSASPFRPGFPHQNDTQCFKHDYVREWLGLQTSISGFRSFRDEDIYRNWLSNLCRHTHKRWTPNSTWTELRSLGFNESHLAPQIPIHPPPKTFRWCLERLGFAYLFNTSSPQLT